MKKNESVSIYKADGIKVMLVTEIGVTLEDALSAFENVLRGQGYHFKGNLIIEVEND